MSTLVEKESEVRRPKSEDYVSVLKRLLVLQSIRLVENKFQIHKAVTIYNLNLPTSVFGLPTPAIELLTVSGPAQ
jgi:hypothetical protein